MLSQIESGTAVPSVKTLTYLAQVLELPPSVLLPDASEGPDGIASSEPPAATVTAPQDAVILYSAKEAYLAEKDTEAYDLLSSIEETSPLFDEVQALFARVALRLASARSKEENFTDVLELAKSAATAAAKGLYSSTEVKSQALLLLSDAAAKLAQL